MELIRRLKKRVQGVISQWILASLSWLIPKREGYWVCLSLHSYGKYAGNARFFFEYAVKVQQEEGILIEYLTPFVETQKRLQELGLPVRRMRLGWLLPTLRAEVVITDGLSHFLSYGRYQVAQLWHGTGYKNIVLADPRVSHSRLARLLVRRSIANTLFIAATSEDDRVRKNYSFGTKKSVTTGSPRTDSLVKHGHRLPDNGALPRITRILYAPTFRDRTPHLPFQGREWEELDAALEAQGAQLQIKRHPKDDKLQIPSYVRWIQDVTDRTEDVQLLLESSDALISDYSGISSDFVLLGKPMIFYVYDYQEYVQNNRSFYYDLMEFLPGPFAYSVKDLTRLLSDLTWFVQPEYQKKYQEFSRRTNLFKDGKSSERVMAAIQAALDNDR